MVSLLEIVEGMLLASPQFIGKASIELVIPGGILEHPLLFPRQVVLYTSDNNPGAAAVVEELNFQGLTGT